MQMSSRGVPYSRQRGAILAITAVLLVVLLGIAALALDLGRVLTLRTEMQNAVDAAALAGAAELNGKPGAINRAKAAARQLLVHKGHHAFESELLGDAMPADDVMPPYDESPEELQNHIFVFFCAIGSEYDVDNSCVGDKVDGGLFDGKILATGDEDAHYVWVHLKPEEDSEAYTVPLYFLPVLSFATGDPKTFQKVAATALAGRHFLMCNYPPIMMCDPFEGVGGLKNAIESGDFVSGDMVLLKGQSDSWSPGDFGYLQVRTQDGYKGQPRTLGEYLGNPCNQGCSPPLTKVRPGSVQSWPERGLNTMFEYGDAFDFPAAPNVIEYPFSPNAKTWDPFDPGEERFYTREWPIREYLERYHQRPGGGYDEGFSLAEIGADYAGCVGVGSTIIDPDVCPSRWDIYNREITSGHLPLNPLGMNDAPGAGTDNPPVNDDIVDPDRTFCVTAGAGCPDYTDGDDPWTFNDCGNGNKCWPDKGDPYAVGRIPDGLPDPDNLNLTGEGPAQCGDEPSDVLSVPDRRTLYVAVISCQTQNDLGNMNPGNPRQLPIDAFAKFFLLQRAPIPSSGKLDLVAEFIDLASEEDAEYKVEVQLYE